MNHTVSQVVRMISAVLVAAFAASATRATACQSQPTGTQPATDGRAAAPLSTIEPASTGPARPGIELPDQGALRDEYEAARDLIDDHQYDAAIARLDAAIRSAPDDCFELHYLLATARFESGRTGEARAAAEFAALLRPQSADVHHLLGRLLRAAGNLPRAAAHFRSATRAAEHEPNNARVTASWFELGRCLEEQGYLAAASECYARFDLAAWDSHPEHRNEPLVEQILQQHPRGMIEETLRILLGLGRTDDALRAARWAAQHQPDDSYIGLLCATTLLNAGRADEAFELCRSKLSGDNLATYLSLAVRAARAAGKLAAWSEELTGELSTPESLQLARRLATGLGTVGEHAIAASVWRKLVAAKPDDVDAAWALAVALKDSGDLEAAVRALSDVVRTTPEPLDPPQARLAEWMKPLDRTDAFLALMGRMAAIPPDDFALAYALGSLAAAAEQDALAIRLFETSLKARPEFTAARLAWGEMLLAHYRWNEAREQADQALQVSPKLAAAHYLLARALSGLDDLDGAEAAFREALRLNPREAQYALEFGRHYRRLNNIVAAQRYFQQAQSLAPDDPEMVELLIDSYLNSGKSEIAISVFERVEPGLPEDVRRRLQTSIRFARAGGTPDDYIAELLRQTEAYPDDRVTAVRCGEALYVRRRFDEAARLAQRALGFDPDNYEARLLSAAIAARRLDFDVALAQLESLAGRYSNRRALLFTLGDCYVNDFQPERARSVYEHLLSLGLSDAERNLARAKLILAHSLFRDYDGALARLDGWLAEARDKNDLLAQKWNLLTQAGRNDQAVALVTEWLNEAPADEQRWLHYADACLRAKAYDRVEQRLREWISTATSSNSVTLLTEALLRTLLAAGRPRDALNVINGFQPSDPAGDIFIRGWRAIAESEAGQHEDAIKTLTALLEERILPFVPGELERARRTLVSVLVESKQVERALEWCDRWLSNAEAGGAVEQIIPLLEMKSQVLQGAERRDDYIAVMERLLKLRPHDAGANNDLGYTYVEMGRELERAAGMIRLAVSENPLNRAFLDSLGWVYYKRGDFSLAKKYLKRSVTIFDGDDATVYDHLGDAEFRLGDAESARRAWARCVELAESDKERAAAPENARLIAEVRAKLAAQERGGQPAVAPTADGK
ncbi:MAG: Beta-barrel assembly-enhancing protease [Phycisphaerae bacterium]|nr:Beta-barrel assembly-enhancing protease [Phycisphaerae bacterium]